MSFEGYYQILCRSGHLTREDVYAKEDRVWQCRCGAVEAWRNLVDQTNGTEAGWVQLKLVQPDKFGRCNMGHRHVVEWAVYKIPGT